MTGRRGSVALLAAAVPAVLLGGCGDQAPATGDDGLVEATPRALAAVVEDHVEGAARRTTGRWSDWNDPLEIEGQVDYGVDPEGSEDGETRTVRTRVADLAAYTSTDRRWLRCRDDEVPGTCQEEAVDGGRLLYRWSRGVEEEEAGGYSWTVVREDEVVVVSYEGSGLLDEDPRGLDLPLDPDDLRAAALDPAMSLRTTAAAWQAGAGLDDYHGMERKPVRPEIVPTTPEELAQRWQDYLVLQPSSIRPSRLTDLGPDAVGVHLEYPGTRRYDAFTVDILTAVGRAQQIDPLPCPVQRSRTAARDSCFSLDADTAITWTLATDDRPGTLWIIGAQDDDKFNRVESVAIRIVTPALVDPLYTDSEADPRLPPHLLEAAPITSDLSLGPETTLP